MAGPVSDDVFARYINQIGNATLEQIDAAKAVQAEQAGSGVLFSLADVLVQQNILTAAIRANIEKKLRAQQDGGLKQLGNYKLLKKLGEGGMGTVYLAEDTHAQRKVALKVLPKKHAADSEFLTRFRREAQATGKLNHVNIIAAYSTGEDMGHHFYAMEFCEGDPLDKLLKNQRVLPWDKALEIVTQVARGLKHAHDHGFIHRDIKPPNIFITAEGVAKILDLGLSKNIGDSTQSFNTQSGVALGTPHYISPEQARGDKSIDGRTDIYSLGATFYHLVTGETPFQGSTAAMIMMKHLTDQLPNPQDIRDDIPDGVVQVIQKMMTKDPADRYADCEELLADLEEVIDGKIPSSHAIEIGKSSIAMRRVMRGATDQAADRMRPKTGTRQHEPDARRGNDRRAPAPNRKPLYIAGGVLGLALILSLIAIRSGGKSTDIQAVIRTDPTLRPPEFAPPADPPPPLIIEPDVLVQKPDVLPDEASLDVGDRAKLGSVLVPLDFGAKNGTVPALQKGEVSTAPLKTINLLKLVDLKKDTVYGAWTLADGALLSDKAGDFNPTGGGSRMQIPYRPPEEYDYKVVFTRLRGSHCAGLIFPARGLSLSFIYGGYANSVSGFELVNGQDAHGEQNTTMVRKPAWRLGVKQTARLEVRKTGTTAYINGALLTQTPAGYAGMTSPDFYRLPDPRCLGISSFASPTAFHEIEVTEISGKGTFARAADPAAIEADQKRSN